MVKLLSLLSAAAMSLTTFSAETTITNAADLAKALKSLPPELHRFTLRAKIGYVLNNATNTIIFALQDGTGHAWVSGNRNRCKETIQSGDEVSVAGHILCAAPGHTPSAGFTEIKVLGHGSPVKPRPATIGEITTGHLDWNVLRIVGLVRDVYPSETSPYFAVMILTDGHELQRVNISLVGTRLKDLVELIGDKVAVVGFPNLNSGSFRSFAGREFQCSGLDDILVLDSSNKDPFDAPALETLLAQTTAQIATTGRIKARGLVLCTWSGSHALVRTEFSDVFQIHCSQGASPKRGDFIEATGFPLSDNFHITLTHALWRKTAPLDIKVHPSTDIPKFAKLLACRDSTKAKLHGYTVVIHGKIRNMPDPDVNINTILVEDDACIIPIDVSSVSRSSIRATVGCDVEITGTYVMMAGYEHTGSPFSKATGFQIILNRSEDIKVVRNPPWWTVGRLLAVIGTLLAALAGIFIWNVTLRRLALRKSRELFRAQLGQVKADLRTEERTRLAVELHDTLAQNLTGVSMEIEAANDLRGDAPQPMLDHLGIAAKALKSCRDELRNCLWDLRSQALEEPDMTKAVLKTLQPVVNDSRLAVRFNVPRARLSDNTAHALLRVIRELVVNAIRHGNASAIKVAGTIDNGKLLCSVTDDGCGFDPDAAPGVLQGHFGLQGIQERIEELGGEFTIRSSCGKGTKATINIPIPHES